MRTIVAMCLAAWLAACSVWPAGKDPQGLALSQAADAVLAALNTCIRDQGKPPETLQALVPPVGKFGA